MNWGIKRDQVEIIVSSFLVGIFLIYNTFYGSIAWMNWLLVIITIGLCIIIKMLMSEQLDKKYDQLINIFILSAIFRGIIVVCTTYLFEKKCFKPINTSSIYLQGLIIDSVCMVLGLYTYRFNKYLKDCLYLLTAILMVLALGSLKLETKQENVLQKIVLIIGIVATIYIIGSMRRKGDVFNSVSRNYVKMLIVLKGIHYILYILNVVDFENCRRYTNVSNLISLLIVFFLFLCTYQLSLKGPWSDKIKGLNEAEAILYKQGTAGEMVAHCSHELKTPINIIRSALTILNVDLKEKAYKIQLEQIRVSCNELMNLIQNVIDIQKVRSKQIKVHSKDYNMVEVIENVADAISEKFPWLAITFDPLEEEIYSKVDCQLFQHGMVCFLSLLACYKEENPVYIVMIKNEEEAILEIIIQCKTLVVLRELKKGYLSGVTPQESEVIALTTIRLLELIAECQKGKMQQTQDEISIIFPLQPSAADEWLGEENKMMLKDYISSRYALG